MTVYGSSGCRSRTLDDITHRRGASTGSSVDTHASHDGKPHSVARRQDHRWPHTQPSSVRLPTAGTRTHTSLGGSDGPIRCNGGSDTRSTVTTRREKR